MEIEKLDLDVKTFNRLKKAGISTVDELLAEMYSSGSKVSQPDAKHCEVALKGHGIIRFMRGDAVEESDIEPEPLTWDELHSYIGRLVVKDCSTESHRWLVVCWIYDISDEGEGRVTYISNSREYCYSDRSTVNGGYSSLRRPSLKHEGQFFALKTSEVPQEQSSPVIVESAEYTRAVALHRKICVSAELAEQNLFEMCKGLCEMRDYKLYRELGYKNFEDYCTQELKITRRQGQKYAAIASLETIDNGKSTSHFEKLGTEKLYLLSQIEETARIEIMGKTNLENTSVRELKVKIAELSKSKDKLIDDLKNAYDERDRERGYREELVDENGKMSDRISELIADNDEAQDTIRTLEHQIEELEARPVDVTIESADVKALKEAHDKDIEALNDEHKRKLEQLKDKYEKQMNEGIAKAKELAQAPDISQLWRALDISLDNAVEAIEDFFEEYEDHPKIKDFASCLKTTIRDLNKLMNDVLAGEK